jgi:hypothetical protein
MTMPNPRLLPSDAVTLVIFLEDYESEFEAHLKELEHYDDDMAEHMRERIIGDLRDIANER